MSTHQPHSMGNNDIVDIPGGSGPIMHPALRSLPVWRRQSVKPPDQLNQSNVRLSTEAVKPLSSGTGEHKSPQVRRDAYIRLLPDGSEITRYNSGEKKTTKLNGTVIVEYPNGYKYTKKMNGVAEIGYPDGTKALQFPDGVTIIEFPDGRTKTVDADGNRLDIE